MLSRWPAAPDDRPLLHLLQHWLAARGQHAMPTRRDIDPTSIPKVLPWISLYDCTEEGGFRCRLFGYEIDCLFDHHSRGLLVEEIMPAAEAAEVSARLARVRDEGVVDVTLSIVTLSTGLEIPVKRIALPLSTNGGDVDVIVGASSYRIGPSVPVGVPRASRSVNACFDLSDQTLVSLMECLDAREPAGTC